MKCKGCDCELGEYCLDCQEKGISEAFARAAKARQKKGHKGLIIFEDDPMYEVILARRDLEARSL